MAERVGLVGNKDHRNKLKTDVGCANVEDGAEDALENHALSKVRIFFIIQSSMNKFFVPHK